MAQCYTPKLLRTLWPLRYFLFVAVGIDVRICTIFINRRRDAHVNSACSTVAQRVHGVDALNAPLGQMHIGCLVFGPEPASTYGAFELNNFLCHSATWTWIQSRRGFLTGQQPLRDHGGGRRDYLFDLPCSIFRPFFVLESSTKLWSSLPFNLYCSIKGDCYVKSSFLPLNVQSGEDEGYLRYTISRVKTILRTVVDLFTCQVISSLSTYLCMKS